jgi:SAM-dependent methyltransferase
MEFKDHFSLHAQNYVKHRPTYPNEIYDLIYRQVSEFKLAWDCGTGNGQVALELAERFEKVIATDASESQILNAIPHPKVSYAVSKAEESGIAEHSVDLVTVGQAIHWFHFEPFFKEVQRVLKPGGIFACWTYKYLTINPELDAILHQFFEIIESYWPPERDHVMAEYASIPFPEHFKPLDFPNLYIERAMTADETLDYLRTWSSVKNYKLQHQNQDPLAFIQKAFYEQWGDIQQPKIVRHPLITKLFKLPV